VRGVPHDPTVERSEAVRSRNDRVQARGSAPEREVRRLPPSGAARPSATRLRAWLFRRSQTMRRMPRSERRARRTVHQRSTGGGLRGLPRRGALGDGYFRSRAGFIHTRRGASQSRVCEVSQAGELAGWQNDPSLPGHSNPMRAVPLIKIAPVARRHPSEGDYHRGREAAIAWQPLP